MGSSPANNPNIRVIRVGNAHSCYPDLKFNLFRFFFVKINDIADLDFFLGLDFDAALAAGADFFYLLLTAL